VQHLPATEVDVIPLPLLTDHLPVPPATNLNPLLDAVATCLARHGLSRTSMSDIARELGVAPSTVYRKVGSVEKAAWLLAAREAHAFLTGSAQVVAGIDGPRAVSALLAAGIRAAWDHPVFAKMVRDEPDFVGRALTRDLPRLVEQGVDQLVPFLTAATELGIISPGNPALLAHWLVRVVIITLLAPPPGPLEEALDELVLPMLGGPPTSASGDPN
jgi:AcrR family transcriptional regulator